MIRATTIAIALALAGCAGVPAEQRAALCQTTDWTQFGENDGILGVPVSDRADRFLDCSELGLPVDLAAYNTGRQKGLETYCTVQNGLQVGLEGRPYRNVCPPELETAFLQGLAEGHSAAPVRVDHRYGYGSGIIFGPKFFFGKRGFRGRKRFGGSRFHRRGFKRHRHRGHKRH